MSDDKELQVRLQFLEEAGEYLDNIESGLLGLGLGQVTSQQMDGVLRAAHSIKGGAAMMGFQSLSHLAHRLEDFFKVLKIGKSNVVDSNLESLFLSTVDFLRQIIVVNRQRKEVTQEWLATTVDPVFEQLHDILGDPQPEDAAALLSAEMGEDMSTLIFETEVEELLVKLETSIETLAPGNLLAELKIAAQELDGLGEMLELSAFSSLCQSVITQVEATPERVNSIAQTAIQEWRRSQALVLIGQTEVLPNTLEMDADDAFFSDVSIEASDFFEELPTSNELASLMENEGLEEEDLALFSSLEAIFPEDLSAIDFATMEISPEFPVEEIIPEFSFTAEPDNSIVNFPELPQSRTSITNSPQTIEEDSRELTTVTDKTIRVAVKQLEHLSDLFGEVAIERNGLGLRLKSLRNLVNLLSQRIKTLEQSNFRLRIAYDKVATEAISPLVRRDTDSEISMNAIAVTSTPVLAINPASHNLESSVALKSDRYFDSLEMDSYSDIHLLSQEVMETIVQLQEVTKDIEINLEDTEKNSRELNRTTKQMQGTITRVRMRPLSDLLDRFPRALRDLELQYGKKVQLKVQGTATLVERSILESLNDPLLHLFRNAFDHGIEFPATRKAAGKPEQGTITITANNRGNQTVITIKDDGGGIDLEKIKSKALSMGVSPEDILKAKEEDLLDLIFEPGFSTAASVTDLSGRGVGMDVVKTNIEQINGKIQVKTEFGVGTTFTITVPFTLSVVRVLLVESNGILLAFPTNIVEEMLILDPDSVLEAAGQEVLNWDGFIVRLIRLNQWLNLPDFASATPVELEETPTIEEPLVLMIAQNNDLVGIQVDRYWQEQEVTIRSVEGKIALPPGFTGCSILGNGRVVPLIDAIALLSWIENDRQASSTSSRFNFSYQNLQDNSEKTTTSVKKIIMVVDDSINVRRFLALTLEKANYRVEQAKDGQDAIDKLQAGVNPQAVICDIEMPRLDGFGFLSRVKTFPQHKNLPVIMLTSRSGDKHRRLAINLGATEYFSKPFKENVLLSTLQKLVT
jgi:two-component system, chemotaxis family, sensor histidine kinase and response regulator PixL